VSDKLRYGRLGWVCGFIGGASLMGLVWLATAAFAQEHIVVDAIICDGGCGAMEVRVWDGDSIRLGMTSDAEAIRIRSIDAPEISEPACPREALAAAEARDRLAELLQAGPIAIQRTGRDRYGRTLADLEVAGADIGSAMIAEGLVLPYGPDRRAAARSRWCSS
jgi:endonuclease YncB( thermonuclease family)